MIWILDTEAENAQEVGLYDNLRGCMAADVTCLCDAEAEALAGLLVGLGGPGAKLRTKAALRRIRHHRERAQQ